MQHPLYGTMYATFSTKSTYYCYEVAETGKKALFIGVSDTQVSDHASVCIDLLTKSCKQSLDKAKTVELRTKLLKKCHK